MSVQTVCDAAGCRSNIDIRPSHWQLELEATPRTAAHGPDEPKHFCDLACLRKWVNGQFAVADLHATQEAGCVS